MLHGDIRVNEVRVGCWEARNLGAVSEGGSLYRYECKLLYRNTEGHPLHAEFEVIHYRDSGGAGHLAALVIYTGMKKLKGYPPGQPTEFPV